MGALAAVNLRSPAGAPSAVLRGDDDQREVLMDGLVTDMRRAATLAR